MKIHELDKSIEGKRIRVTRVAPSQAEKMGYVDDTDRLTGQTGTVEDFVSVGSLQLAQLRVSWDSSEPGTLALAGEDEIEVIYRYHIVQTEGDLYCWVILDSKLGCNVKNANGYEARFLSEQEARAVPPANETDPGICWG